MEDSRECRRRRIGGASSFTIDLCECGAVHLTIGFATLRLEPHAYRELASAIAQGARSLEQSVPPFIH
jgi:hypothetical protein